jgi:hypothetical protein
VDAQALTEWHGGQFLGATDADLLVAAWSDGRVVVTYDLRTLPELLRAWSEDGINHGGAVFVDQVTIRPSDVGGLVHALASLAAARVYADWTDRTELLRRAQVP